MAKRIVIVMLLLVTCVVSFAQERQVDVIYLKNGSVIKGTVIELVPDKQVKIRMADGSLFVYRMDEVDRIEKEFNHKYVQKKSSPLKAKAIGTAEMVYGFASDDFLLGVNFLWGYRFNPFLSLSGGVGLSLAGYYNYDYDCGWGSGCSDDNVAVLLPVFARFQVNFLKTRVSPFFSMDLGYLCALDDYGHGMAIINPALGLSVRIGKRFALNTSLGYQVVDEGYMNRDKYSYGSSSSDGAATLKVGFVF